MEVKAIGQTTAQVGRSLLIARHGPSLAWIALNKMVMMLTKTLLPKKFKPPEQDAGEQGGRATDVDREHQVDLACVLHLERDGRIVRVMLR